MLPTLALQHIVQDVSSDHCHSASYSNQDIKIVTASKHTVETTCLSGQKAVKIVVSQSRTTTTRLCGKSVGQSKQCKQLTTLYMTY